MDAVKLAGLAVAVFGIGVIGFNLLTFALLLRHQPRPPGLWAALGRELLACLILLPVWPLWLLLGASYPRRVEALSSASAAGRPVVLIHGYAMNRTNWFWLGRAMAARGLGPLYAFNYFSLAAVKDSAAALSEFIESVCVKTGAREVDIVAHSMGGLVGRYYVEKLGGASRVAHLITIATPHRGSSLARFALGAGGRDHSEGSPLLLELERAGRTEEVAYTSIWSTCDNLVVPPQSSRLGGPGEDVVLDGIGHLGLLTSPRVVEAITSSLAQRRKASA